MIVKTFVICAFVRANFAISNNIDHHTTLTEDDRRAAEEDTKSDLKSSQTQNRGLWVIGQNPSQESYHSYPSAEGAAYGSTAEYGHTSSGYNFGNYGNNYGNGYGLAKPSGFGHDVGYGGYSHGYATHEYEYDHRPEEDKGSGLSMIKGLSLKKLLLPLAGLALLGTAAVLSSHPVLLQLGTISSGRRKRSISRRHIFPSNPLVRPKNK